METKNCNVKKNTNIKQISIQFNKSSIEIQEKIKNDKTKQEITSK